MKTTFEQFISTRYRLIATNKEGEYRTTCPFCANPDDKFYFRFQYSTYYCYHCGSFGYLYNFVKNNHKDINVRDLSNGYYSKIAKIIDKKPIPLPSDYISLSNVKSYTGIQYLNYLYGRGFPLNIIQSYKFGYSPSKSFHLIIPIYNEIGEQVYYTSRLIRDDISNEKVYNPPSRSGFYSKADCIFNFNKVIGRDTIYIFEGAFNALAASLCGFNSVAILGKVISESQLDLLLNGNFKNIVICLDDDATKEADSLGLKLSPYFKVYRVYFPEDRDANDLLLENKLVEYLKYPKPFSSLDNLKMLLKKFKKF